MSIQFLKRIGLLAALIPLLWSPVALAGPKDVVVELSQSKVVTKADGHETLERADTALPGDVIEYRVEYRNKGKDDITGLAASLPIPAGTRFTGLLNPSGNYLASVDGKSFEKAPLQREVKRPDGKVKLEPVPLDQYRALRWPLGTIKASKSQVVTARVQIIPLDIPVPQPTRPKAE